MPIQGIIFDMDNTLLQSRIDFAAMKRHIYEYLFGLQLLPGDFPLSEHTSSTMLEQAKSSGLTAEMYAAAMDIATEHELRGMEGAGLERGALQVLEALHGRYTLVVVTNNSRPAALKALEITGVAAYFDLIAGREQMTALKPSSSGFSYVLEQFPQLPASNWLSVGDSWIDGAASAGAGIAFVSYKTDPVVMKARGVEVTGHMQQLSELEDLLASGL
ncbi:HAD family hydrolase [Paenibacillus filicis]|uniref:HAD family hydrolase n=1 Tax=Paenibacillus filicis TaxID=669464 RepID=A0ABU9DG27_9BACL